MTVNGHGNQHDNEHRGGISRRQSLAGAAGLLAAGTAGALGFGLDQAGTASATTTTTAATTPVADSSETFVTRPTLRPPAIRVTNYGNSDPFAGLPGLIALSPKTIDNASGVQSGALLTDTQGRVVWFQPVSGIAFDTNVQSYNGTELLTYWAGSVDDGVGSGTAYLMAEHFQKIRTVSEADGVKIDLHELNVTSQGTVLLTGYSTKRMDLSAKGGSTNGLVQISHAFEVDIATGKVVWTWNSLRHVPIAASYIGAPKNGNVPYDYFHMNSICDATDGNIIISSRHCWAIYKVDKRTGKIIWTLNGKDSDFKSGKGAGFAWQHHVRQINDNQFTVFDNASSRTLRSGFRSRGLILNVDQTSMEVTLAHAYEHPAGFLSNTQGSVQVMSNGNVFVGWGVQPYFSLFSEDGTLLADGELPQNLNSYRAFLVDWPGQPGSVPAAAVLPGANGGYVVYASWNGVAGIDHWRVFAGSSSGSLKQVGWQPWGGFESSIIVNSPGPYFQAVAVDASNKVMGSSQVIRTNAGTSSNPDNGLNGV